MQNLKIVKKHNQKGLIFLLKSDFGIFAVAALSAQSSFKVTDTKLLTHDELFVIQEQKEILGKRGISIVDLTEVAQSATDLSSYAEILLLPGAVASIPTYAAFKVIPSPYVVFSFDDAQFFSTQKTRGPNMY